MSDKSQKPEQQAVDATICSIDSTGDGPGSMTKAKAKPESKVKAYVDFSDFNKNYEEHLRSKGQKDKDLENDSKQAALDNTSKTPEDWEILS